MSAGIAFREAQRDEALAQLHEVEVRWCDSDRLDDDLLDAYAEARRLYERSERLLHEAREVARRAQP